MSSLKFNKQDFIIDKVNLVLQDCDLGETGFGLDAIRFIWFTVLKGLKAESKEEQEKFFQWRRTNTEVKKKWIDDLEKWNEAVSERTYLLKSDFLALDADDKKQLQDDGSLILSRSTITERANLSGGINSQVGLESLGVQTWTPKPPNFIPLAYFLMLRTEIRDFYDKWEAWHQVLKREEAKSKEESKMVFNATSEPRVKKGDNSIRRQEFLSKYYGYYNLIFKEQKYPDTDHYDFGISNLIIDDSGFILIYRLLGDYGEIRSSSLELISPEIGDSYVLQEIDREWGFVMSFAKTKNTPQEFYFPYLGIHENISIPYSGMVWAQRIKSAEDFVMPKRNVNILFHLYELRTNANPLRIAEDFANAKKNKNQLPLYDDYFEQSAEIGSNKCHQFREIMMKTLALGNNFISKEELEKKNVKDSKELDDGNYEFMVKTVETSHKRFIVYGEYETANIEPDKRVPIFSFISEPFSLNYFRSLKPLHKIARGLSDHGGAFQRVNVLIRTHNFGINSKGLYTFEWGILTLTTEVNLSGVKFHLKSQGERFRFDGVPCELNELKLP